MRAWLSSILCFICVFLYAQQKTDSLLNVYENLNEDTSKVNTAAALFNAYLYNDASKAKKYAFEEKKLAEQLDYQKGVGMSLYHLGSFYYNYNKLDSSSYYYEKALNSFESSADVSGIASAYHGLAILNYSLGQYDSALALLDKNINLYQTSLSDSLSLAISFNLKASIHIILSNYQIALQDALRAIRILENLNSPIRLADTYTSIASIEFHLKNYKESKNYNQQALAIYEKYDDFYFQSQAYNDLGNTYFYMGSYQEAIQHLTRSLEIAEQMKIPEIEVTALTNLGKTYMALELADQSVDVLNESVEKAEKLDNPIKLIEALTDLGETYITTENPSAAIPLLNRAINMADSLKLKSSLQIAYFRRSKAYEKMNMYEASLSDYQQYSAFSDSILNERRSQQIEELRTIYETEKKEQQIELQEKEIALLQEQERAQNLRILLLAGGLVLALIAIYAIRQKLKRNKAEKEKVDAELAHKKKELTTHALHLAKKNEVLEGLKQKAQQLNDESSQEYGQLIRTIEFDLKDDNNWENFSRYFEQVHKDFNKRVKNQYPEVSSNELRLLALLKMNLSSKEIANILNISQEGIKKARYRLRKKLNISTDESLQDLALNL